MIPISYSVKDNIVRYHYKASDLFDFVRNGKEHGNVGFILTKREDNLLTYRGFGTIESPFTDIITITTVHFPSIDGVMPTDEERLVPPKSLFTNSDREMKFLDFSK